MVTTNSRTVAPCSRIVGELTVPGDKSVSHRAAMLAALATGESTLTGFLASEDCLNTLSAVEALGATVKRKGTDVTISGTGGVFSRPNAALDLGNSGTGMRLLVGLLAGQPFETELTGDASLCSRPMRRIQEPLEAMGACVELSGETGTAPMRVGSAPLHAISYPLPVASAQVKSCVLLAGLYAEGTTTVIEPRPTRDHTEQLLRAMGVPVTVDGLSVSLDGFGAAGPRLTAGSIDVPGDFSSAAFWIVAAACRPGSRVTIRNVGLNPRRTALLDVLKRMGAGLSITQTTDAAAGEPMGDVTVDGSPLHGTTVEGNEIPNLIDELPLVAVAGAMADGVTIIRGAEELRVKESDRIATTVAMLQAVGVQVEEAPDGMTVTGGPVTGNVAIDSHGDHRIAMCAAILGLVGEAPVEVVNTDCIATSYPSFWDDLERVSSGEEDNVNVVIAIDGPAASGKSTVARKVAAALDDALYVDSGAIYRGIAWAALERGVDVHDADAVARMLADLDVGFFSRDGAVGFGIDGVEPGMAIRTRAVNDSVSPVAVIPAVRVQVVKWLKGMAALGTLVMEGRDIGTAVFPGTPHKFYLDASAEERTRRRHREMATEDAVDEDEVGKSLRRRDKIDSSRKMDPLQVAPGATRIDSTAMAIDEVVESIVAAVKGMP
ncbi:MAG: 3-phosphoshikimate 1-carboxyvinyltransferase [Kiritimatiellia bacterium]|nr:3-phosphoshikimate 1-carboxyvinyltransferase [Kiritimatiellia bacterium]MDP6629960.1 3-phosphoshikimate 1-carboxyvinyltransferase [Kiritimatiellia bacterium]MDP6810158.1 3-phosphoshikimate 1-carboxyvinyltransferase [Kiritimatiellia bacterium]MDP7023624.1 3-phosphoshikimate 1-carboxyvinyltransferase [Kiritimatiellia bacterium]